MATMPIQNPAIPPSVIRNLPPGDVPDWLLFTVEDARTGRAWRMAELPARAMRALHAKCLERGILLTSTGRTRSFQQQYSLFLTRHDPVSASVYQSLPASGGYRRYWPDAVPVFHLSSPYWRLKAGMAAAAVPSYTAPHVTGCADDTAEIVNGSLVSIRPSTVDWLYGVAPAYGFKWSLTSEPWHLQWVMGDAMPQAVLDYERSLQPLPPPTEVTPPVITPAPSKPGLPFGEDQLATARLTVEGRNAQFFGTGTLMPDGSVHCLLITWSRPGESPMYNDHANAPDTVHQPTSPETLKRDCVLVGNPSEIQDSRYSWSAADFAGVS